MGLSVREQRACKRAVEHLAHADYEAAVALRLLEETKTLLGWEARCKRGFEGLLKLRHEIEEALNA